MKLRILADDLTGALDSTAQFCGACGPIPVRFAPDGRDVHAAYDMASRDRPAAAAAGRVAAFAGRLAEGDPAFQKIDSLLRGHWPIEVRAAMASGFRTCVLAPAFPGQGRVTRQGRQWARDASGEFQPIDPPIVESLGRAGIGAHLATPGVGSTEAGVHVFDAETDADLAAIVKAGRRCPGPVLWCGAAGLAAALAGARQPFVADLGAPVLAIIGSHNPASLTQVAALAATFPAAGGRALGPHAGVLSDDGGSAGLVTFDIPPGTGESEARAMIASALARALPGMPQPATLVAAGGETLRTVCEVLATDHLRVEGEFAVGVPVSTMIGGGWDGTRVVSKSGAFGAAELLVRIFEACGAGVPSGALRT